MYGIAEGFRDEGELAHDNLIAGEFFRVAELQTITGSGVIEKGSVLGRMTSDGRYTLSLGTATDGTQIPGAILAQDVDVTTGDREAVIYLTGEFNANALVLGEGHTLESIEPVLNDASIFLKSNQGTFEEE